MSRGGANHIKIKLRYASAMGGGSINNIAVESRTCHIAVHIFILDADLSVARWNVTVYIQ